MRIPKNDVAAVVVDVQERLFPFIHAYEQLEATIVKFVEGLQVLDVPTIVTQQYTKGLGPTIPAVAEALGEHQVYEKMTFSCCGDPAFMEALKATGKFTILLVGIECHICVLQTALDLLENGFKPVLVADGTSSRKPADKEIAMERMREEGIIITTYESILFELCRVAGTDQFKAISRLVK